MAELVDAHASGACIRKDVEVRVLFWAPFIRSLKTAKACETPEKPPFLLNRWSLLCADVRLQPLVLGAILNSVWKWPPQWLYLMSRYAMQSTGGSPSNYLMSAVFSCCFSRQVGNCGDGNTGTWARRKSFPLESTLMFR